MNESDMVTCACEVLEDYEGDVNETVKALTCYFESHKHIGPHNEDPKRNAWHYTNIAMGISEKKKSRQD